VLPALRRALGLTDEWHGHLHAGYDAQSLRALLPATLQLRQTHGYVRFFSFALDTALNAASGSANSATAVRTAKRTIQAGAQEGKPVSAAVKMMYPVMRAFAGLDALLPFTSGYMLVATLERTSSAIEA
jgi:hypothetical protein